MVEFKFPRIKVPAATTTPAQNTRDLETYPISGRPRSDGATRYVLSNEVRRPVPRCTCRAAGGPPPRVDFPAFVAKSVQPFIAWPFKYDCTPPYKENLPIRFGATCSSPRRQLIKTAHRSAYKLVFTAFRTIRYIKFAPISATLRQLLWNWGATPGYEWMWSSGGGGKDLNPAHLASLAHWFGPYSSGKVSTVYNVLNAAVKFYEEGAEVLGSFEGVKYSCLQGKTDGYVATHPDQRHTYLYDPEFWGRNHRGQAATLVHENLHSVYKYLKPRDEKHDICNTANNKCYGVHTREYDSAVPWRHGGNDSDLDDNPRQLVINGAFGYAINNIDNFVGWILRRWDDSQFHECDAPKPLPDQWEKI